MNDLRRAWSAAVPLLAAVLAGGCTLYNEVSIAPITYTTQQIDRGSDVQSMVRQADFLRAIELAPTLVARNRKSAHDLSALGTAYLAAGRYDDARGHLRAAIDLEPYRTTYAQIAWNLSQVEYLSNNFDTSLEWARIANDHGMGIKQWHLEYLEALAAQPVYHFSGEPSASLPMKAGRPIVPRIDVGINGAANISAVIDSGAVLSILSERAATAHSVRRFGKIRGDFYGLLGEPISVQFGMVDRLEIGGIVVEHVPVAIMPDTKMQFMIRDKDSGKQEFRIDFLLGANLLKEFRIELNFDRNRATLTHLTPADRQPAPDQNLFFDTFRPLVRGMIQRKGWYLFVLDTGSEVTFLNESQMKSLPVQVLTPLSHNAMLQGLGGAKKRGAKLEKIEVGIDRWGGTFKTIPMYSSDEHEVAAGIIGENFLKNFNVVIDFGRMRLDLERR